MSESEAGTAANPVRVESLHEAHPQLRAADWRSPLVARLTDSSPYSDGRGALDVSYRNDGSEPQESPVHVSWSGLEEDYRLALNTYQEPVLTEFAALGVACILCDCRAGLEITEVTRRGERVDYWLGDRLYLLEVSGTTSGNLADLCKAKAIDQLQVNPFSKDGYVCATRFASRESRLWFYRFPTS
jgi:hypothetical protein